MMQTRYIVFERTEGASCWTLAYRERSVHPDARFPAIFSTPHETEEWVKNVHSKQRGWWGGEPNQRPMQSYIEIVRLPE